MASKENQCALNNLVYFADPFDRDEFNRVERWKNTLQLAIDRLEITEKALYKACSIINKQFDGCYHCENKRCTAEINKADDCGIEKLEEYLLKEIEKENGNNY